MGDHGLAAVQRFVSEAIQRTSPLVGAEGLSRVAEKLIAPSARGMRPAERLEVYREQFWLRHLPNLEEDFPTLAWVLGGSAAFRTLATQYLCACPPRTWDLQKLGANLASYVATHAPWSDDPLARDAACIDWAFMEAFDAPDAPPFDAGTLAAVSEEEWPRARIGFHPSIRCLSLSHQVNQLRDDLKRRDACVRPPPQDTRVVVWRTRDCSLRSAAIEPLAFELLEALRAGALLGEACEAVARVACAADPTELGPRVGAWFQEWSANAWVSAVTFGG